LRNKKYTYVEEIIYQPTYLDVGIEYEREKVRYREIKEKERRKTEKMGWIGVQ
jgi:hypothetical protein